MQRRALMPNLGVPVLLAMLAMLAVLATLAGCSGQPAATNQPEEAPMTLTLTSTAFADGKAIPDQYSCWGEGVSPPLQWSEAPAGTKSFALIVDDPDAPSGTYVHWVIYNIPSSSTGLAQGVAPDAKLPDGSLQGTNSSRRMGFTSPCPPSGTHRYYFKLHALDVTLDLASGASKDQLLRAMQGHVLAQGQLMGTVTSR
jgi:Raf kinase inhibitor-like YbhB/YbcL family protein